MRVTAREPIPLQVEAAGKKVVQAAYKVHKTLGPGLLENVYEVCIAHELQACGALVETQLALPVLYEGIRVDAGYRLDLLVNRSVVVELKVVEALLPIHQAQLLTYLKLSGHRLGFLINFNVPVIKEGIMRLVL